MSPEEETAERLKMDAQGRTHRGCIMNEATSEASIKAYVVPVHQKSDAAKRMIVDILKSHTNLKLLGLGSLDDRSYDEMAMAFAPREVVFEEEVIRQGDEGDCLYIIERGTFDIFRSFETDAAPIKVNVFSDGALFGELALMYNAPRAATVRCTSESASLWSLERTAFQMMLAKCGVEHLEQYEGWLAEVPILKSLNHHELSQLSELLESEEGRILFDEGEAIVTQGEPGQHFFILEEGTCAAYMDGPQGEKCVKTYSVQGEYFGELALLRSEPRRCTVRATGTGASVLCVSRKDFQNLLGPAIADKMSVDAARYRSYAQAGEIDPEYEEGCITSL